MGEHEQSGMLRVVVVLGLIALVAAASIASITVIRGKMAERQADATFQVDNARISNAFDSNFGSVDLSNKNNYDVPYYRANWGRFIDRPAHISNDAGTNIGNLDSIGSILVTPSIDVPEGAKSVTISFWAQNATGVGVFPVNKTGENYWGYSNADLTNWSIDGQWHFMTKTVDLTGKVWTYSGGNKVLTDAPTGKNRQINLQFMCYWTDKAQTSAFKDPKISFSR